MVGEITALACALCRAVTGVLTKFLSGRIETFALNFVRCAGADLFI